MKLPRSVITLITAFTISLLISCGGGGGGGGDGGGQLYLVDNLDEVQQVATGSYVVLDGSDSAEKNGNEIHYHWVVINAPVDINSVLDVTEINTVNPNFTPDLDGTYEFKLEISANNNGQTETSEQSFEVVASSGNVIPMADAGLNFEARANSTIQLSASSSYDANGDELSYQWSVTPPEGSSSELSNASDEKPTLDVDIAGEYNIELVVNDGENNSAPKNLIITVIEGNARPIAVAGYDIHAVTDNNVVLDGSLSRDAENDTLSYEWFFASKPSSSNASLNNIDTVSPNFTPDVEGAYVISLRVSDGTERSDNNTTRTSDIDNVLVIVTNGDNAPVANAGINQNVVAGSKVTANGFSSYDADGNVLNYTWTLLALPDGSTASLVDADKVRSTFTADVAGEYVVQLVVNDGSNDSVADTATIIATTPNRRPVATLGSYDPVATNTVVQLDGSGVSDEDGNDLTYSWNLSKPDGSSAELSATDEVNPTFTPDVAGDYLVSLTVNDGTEDSETVSVNITAFVTNQAPIANAGSNQPGILLGETVTLNGSESVDNDQDEISYKWSFISSPEGANPEFSDSTLVNPTFVPTLIGSYEMVLVVNDSKANSEPAYVQVTVASPGEGQSPNIEFVDSLEKGLVAYYPFNGDANDESGNGNDGVVNGSANVENNVLEIGNNDQDYLTIPFTLLNGLDTFSVSALIKISSFNTSNTLVSGARSDQFDALVIFYGSDRWNIILNNTVKSFPVDNTIKVGSWHHVLLTRKVNVAELYIDGKFIGKLNNLATDAVLIEENGLLIGQEQDALGGTFDATQSWNGEIDNFSIYNRMLTKLDAEELNVGKKASYSTEDEVTFCVNVTDVEDVILTGESIEWFSDLDGDLGTGECITIKLSAGDHVISVTATDSNSNPTIKTNNIHINAIPEVTITSPANKAEFDTGAIIDFQGMATDAEDGDLSGETLVWSSSIEGVLEQVGESITATLSDGRHVITLTATDSDGAQSSDSTVVCIPLCEIFIDDFEAYTADDWGDWYSDNAIWELGLPTTGPAECYSGERCMATMLDANYPYGPDSRLISPIITLPEVVVAEKLLLRYRHRFSYSGSDYAEVQLRVFESDAWGAWVPLKRSTSYNQVWHHDRIDLTDYAGKKIQIGFLHVDGTERCCFDNRNVHAESSGWYIDDVEIVTQEIPVLADFTDFEGFSEGNWNGWYSSNGIWELGLPTTGPAECYSGEKCMATMSDANYPYGPDSRLISPIVTLPEVVVAEELLLRYRHRFSYSGSDYAEVQLRVFESDAWGAWIPLKKNTSYNQVWHHGRIDLTDYAGKKIQIGFLHVDSTERCCFDNRNVHAESSGWYVDDVEIVTQEIPVLADFTDFEGFSEGSWNGWYSSNGIWELGLPTTGPVECYSGEKCMATMLDVNYPYGPDSRLISPIVTLPEVVVAEELLLRYRHRFSYSGSDYAEIQLRVFESDAWGAWVPLKRNTSFNQVWHHDRIDLTDYAGKKIQIGFLHVDGTERCCFDNRNVHAESSGWYVDDVEIAVQ